MATTYPQDSYSAGNVVAGDYAADQALTTDRAQALVDFDVMAMTRPLSVEFAEGTTVSATYETVATFWVVFPDYSSGLNLVLDIEAKVSAGTGDWRLQDNGDTVNATAHTGITSTSYGSEGPSTLVIASTWVSITERRLINIQGQVTGGNTLSLRNLDRYTLRFTD